MSRKSQRDILDRQIVCYAPMTRRRGADFARSIDRLADFVIKYARTCCAPKLRAKHDYR